jgi:tetratricopeptide (TPR) repeat protein
MLNSVLDSDDSGLCAGLIDMLALLSDTGAARWLLHKAGDMGLLAAPGGYGFHEVFSRETIDAALGELAEAGLVTSGEDAGDDGEDIDDPEAADDFDDDTDDLDFVDLATVAADPEVARVVLERHGEEGSMQERGQRACWVLEEAAGSAYEADYALLARGMTALTHHLTQGLGSDSELMADLLAMRRKGMRALIQHGEDVQLSMEFGERLIADHTRLLGPAHPDSFEPRLDLGLAYLAGRRFEQAIGTFSRLLADQEARQADDADLLLPLTRENLAIAYMNAGQAGTGIRLLEQAVAEYERMLGTESPLSLMARATLGGAYVESGRVGEGIWQIEDAIARLTAVCGSDDPDVARLQENLDAARGQARG